MGTAARKHSPSQPATRLRLLKSYLGLAKEFPLVPITNDEQLRQGLDVLKGLVVKSKLNEFEQGYVAVLRKLIKEYESQRFPVRRMPPIELLKSLVEDHELKHHDLAKQTKIAPSTISDILNGHRKINARHAKAFSKRFKLQLEAFL